jgi:two-component system KDP operon response regulator KdpE
VTKGPDEPRSAPSAIGGAAAGGGAGASTGHAGHGAHILVVDDDTHLLRAVQAHLAAQGFEVVTARTAGEALEELDRRHPDVVLLDLGLPDLDGTAVIERIRATSQTPIIILSARGEEVEKVHALELGADDYLTKPFGLAELVARVFVALRHAARPAAVEGTVFHADHLDVDLARRRVLVGGQEIHLTPTEYELLKVFIANPDRVLTHHLLLQRVWGPEYGREGNYLHVYVAGLRKKLEADPKHPRYLVTEPGVGYRFRLSAAP